MRPTFSCGFLPSKQIMKLRNRTILITGGSSGIGLQLAKTLLDLDNTVIICGRSESKLKEARLLLPNVETIQSDIASESDRQRLMNKVYENHPDCSVLVNNAAIVHKTDFKSDDQMNEKSRVEIKTNLEAPICLSKLFLDHVGHRHDAAIINITTGLVFAPRAVYPVYNATKAGLHSFTQALRLQLKKEQTKIIEVMMPVVDTPWHKGDVPRIAISPEQAVAEMIRKIEKGKLEIHVGAVRTLYLLWRISPNLALRMINNIDDRKSQ